MTDKLRTAAQDVLTRWDSPDWKRNIHTGVFIQALREALAEPSPIDALVAWQRFNIDGSPGCCYKYPPPINEIPARLLYAAPVFLDVIIEEAVAKEREACAKICSDMYDKWEYTTHDPRCLAELIKNRSTNENI